MFNLNLFQGSKVGVSSSSLSLVPAGMIFCFVGCSYNFGYFVGYWYRFRYFDEYLYFQVEPEVVTDQKPPVPRTTTTEEPLPGYDPVDNNDLPGYEEEDIPGYANEDLPDYTTDLPPPLPFPTTEGSMTRAISTINSWHIGYFYHREYFQV